MSQSSKQKRYTPEERDKILNDIMIELSIDDRILAAINVGSSAYNFKDKYSDLDIAVVVKESEDLMTVFEDWFLKITEMFNVIHSFRTIFSPNSLLHGFFLANFLEIDMGFQPLSNIYAKRKHWRVVFDKTGSVEQIMKETWEERANRKPKIDYDEIKASWYYINQILIAIARKNYYRAFYELMELKKMIIEIVNHSHNRRVKRFQEISELPDDFQDKFAELFITSFEEDSLLVNLKKTVKLLFTEAKKVMIDSDLQEIISLEKNMSNLIELFEVLIQPNHRLTEY